MTEMFRKHAIITAWKKVANFKRAIVIEGPPIGLMRMSDVKTEKRKESWKEKKSNSLSDSNFSET